MAYNSSNSIINVKKTPKHFNTLTLIKIMLKVGQESFVYSAGWRIPEIQYFIDTLKGYQWGSHRLWMDKLWTAEEPRPCHVLNKEVFPAVCIPSA